MKLPADPEEMYIIYLTVGLCIFFGKQIGKLMIMRYFVIMDIF
jgi:hypothetical protein